MSNTINYASAFRDQLAQKYALELVSSDLKDQGVRFTGSKTVNIPNAVMSGYKMHDRDGGFGAGTATLTWTPKVLEFDRSIEFFVDAMDVDESNQTAAAAKLTNTFEKEQAIPELDAYRFSKIFSLYSALGGSHVVDTDLLTVKNVLLKFDEYMEAMDDAGVPADGRILYVTSTVNSLIKNASGVYRQFGVQSGAGKVDRAISMLDDVKIKVVPKGRFMTAYEFDNGFTPDSGAKQINMILLHPSAVIAVEKHNVIYLWPSGSHQKGDGWLYQNRRYGDLFLMNEKADGIKINASTTPVQPPAPAEVIAYSVAADGTDGAVTSTKITILFGDDVDGLLKSHISLEGPDASGIVVGDLTKSNPKKYELGITPSVNDKTVSVVIEGLDGYEFVTVDDEVTVYVG